MSKTILIGLNNNFSAKTNRWINSLAGLVNLMIAAYFIYKYGNSSEPFGLILGILIFIAGSYSLMYGLTAFSENSKFALRVKVDDKIIEIKNKFFKPVTRLNWSDIQSIEFGLYKITFQLEGTSKVFEYKSNADVSINIKRTIREIADEKNIKVVES